MVTEYHAVEFYDKKKGRNVHSAFPEHVTDDVNYDESIKAVLFLLNSRYNVSLEKTAQFVSDVTNGALPPCVGMINGLCRKFSWKNREEQDSLFRVLPDAPVMHVDGTVARVNGSNNNVVVCSNGMATIYFARENKGHAGIKDTPVEAFGGILIHDHEACFYNYGSDHQKCMVHIERYLRNSTENEKELTWNRKMLELIQEMIHENNLCERKARILKGKINQAISLRSFEHLIYFCECLSVLDHFATDSKGSLYQSVKEVFGRQKPIRSKSKKSESA